MTPGAFTSASDRRWERRYQTIQQRRESPPSRRQQRRENPWRTFDWPDISETLERIREAQEIHRARATSGGGYFSDAVYIWNEEPDDADRRILSWCDDMVNIVNGSWSFAPTDLKDDVESWDAADISCLFD